MNANLSASSTGPITFSLRHSRSSSALLCCALTALALLFIMVASSRMLLPSLVAPLCAIAIVAAHGWPQRWPRGAVAPFVLRVLLYPLLVLFGGRSRLDIDWIFQPDSQALLGTLAAVELALQLWREPNSNGSDDAQLPATPERFPSICFLLLCAIYLGASATRNENYIVWATPIFWSLLLWSLLDWRSIPNTTQLKNPRAARLKPLAQLRQIGRWTPLFWGMALFGGAVSSVLTVHFKDQLMNLGAQMIRDRLPQPIGISNRPQLGSRFEVPESPQRVLRIEGTLADPHLRAASFDYYLNGSWSPPINGRPAASMTAVQLNSTAKGPRARITRLVDSTDNLLFAPLNCSGVLPGKGVDIDGVTVEGDRESGLLRCDELAPFHYEIIDTTQNIDGIPTHQGPLCAPLDEDARRKYLQLPSDLDPRVRALAHRITQSSLHPAQSAELLADYLMQNNAYSYRAKRGDGDPVTNFLLEKRSAHCEYFASALAILARCNDIPSRYVVGYLAHESAPSAFGDSGPATVVRQRDAHAWTELWIDGVGWVTADATPGGGTPQRFGNAPPWQRAFEWAQDTLENIRQRAVQTPKRTWAMIIGIPLGLWILIRARPDFRRRQQNQNADYEQPDQRLNALAARFETWMAREHWMCPPAQSWRRYFSDLERHDVLEWIEKYERARFGFERDAAQLNALESALQDLEQAPQPEIVAVKGAL